MKRTYLSIIILIIITTDIVLSQNKSDIVLNINKKKQTVISGALIGLSLGSYYYLENTWWKEQSKEFHFDNGADLLYALNVDKAGHFMGGLMIADVFQEYFLFLGVDEEKSVWYGSGLGTAIQLGIEIKDAYAPHWGFSTWDLISGTAGSLFLVGKYYSQYLNLIDFKISYWRHSNHDWKLEKQKAILRGEPLPEYSWHNDYTNQTYWMSFEIGHILKKKYWPEFLNIALGFGIDDTQYLDSGKKMGGKNEVYLALDYNISKLFKNYNSKSAKKIKKWINYFKFPSPTIRIYPTTEFYPFFL